MNKKELIKRIDVIKGMLDKSAENINQEVIDEFSRFTSQLINGEKIHKVYEISFVIDQQKQVYIGYTSTELVKRLESSLSTSAADTGVNKIFREKNITKEKFYEIGGKIELIESFWTENEARLREKEEIAKAFYNKNISLLNERCLPKDRD